MQSPHLVIVMVTIILIGQNKKNENKVHLCEPHMFHVKHYKKSFCRNSFLSIMEFIEWLHYGIAIKQFIRDSNWKLETLIAFIGTGCPENYVNLITIQIKSFNSALNISSMFNGLPTITLWWYCVILGIWAMNSNISVVGDHQLHVQIWSAWHEEWHGITF